MSEMFAIRFWKYSGSRLFACHSERESFGGSFVKSFGLYSSPQSGQSFFPSRSKIDQGTNRFLGDFPFGFDCDAVMFAKRRMVRQKVKVERLTEFSRVIVKLPGRLTAPLT